MNTPKNSPKDPTSQTGKRMMLVAWIIGILLLTSLFGRWEKQQFNPNQDPQSLRTASSAEVVLVQNRAGHYVTSGTVNNRPVTFLLDTGATNVAIPGELESYLELERGSPVSVHTANGTATAWTTRIERLQIGDIQLVNVKASIVPGMQGESILLGMSALKGIEFHQKDRRLTLRQSW